MSSLENCYRVMRYIHQHPTERRFTSDVARGVGMTESSLSKLVNRDFPKVFKRIPKVGIGLTGEWPAGGPVDLRLPWDGKATHTESRGEFLWDPTLLRVLNTMWKAHTQQTLLESLQVAEKEDANRIVNLGMHMAEMAKQLIASGVIGTARQDEWTPV